MDVVITSNISDVKNALESAKKTALKAVGIEAERNVKGITPVDTGRLRTSITHEVVDSNSVVIGTNVEYAPYVELGTSKQKAQPYLRPGISNNINSYKSIIEQYLKGS